MPTVRSLALSSIALILTACSAYHDQYRFGAEAHVRRPEYELHFVEADDEGWFWDPSQALAAQAAVAESVEQRDTFVVVFVHGWHHSARCCDENIEGFEDVLLRIRKQLARGMYRGDRGAFRIVGIYVGWRGRSLPGFLDYLTFWGRKDAAERVGETDLQEFMIRLKTQYEAVARDPGQRHLLGLVTIGHSFGGQVVLRATSSFLEHRLADLGPRAHGYLRDAAASHSSPEPIAEPLTGFGDLVVLINPAVEASAYERLHALGQQLAYPPSQAPVMLTLSADDDVPRDSLFTWGRIAGEWFGQKPHKDDPRERALERTALGVFDAQITHRLEPEDPNVVLEPRVRVNAPLPGCSDHESCACTWYEWPSGEPDTPESLSTHHLASAAAVRAYDFSGETTLRGVRLAPIEGKGAIAHQALIVASVDPKVISGHNGIFSEPFVDFLTSYIGWVEIKRLAQMQQQRAAAPAPARERQRDR